DFIGRRLSALTTKNVKYGVIGVLVIAISAWNALIFFDFVKKGTEGDDIGGTGRYIESRKSEPLYTFVLVTDSFHHYYSWGDEYMWKQWMDTFKNPLHKTMVFDSFDFLSKLPPVPNFTVFTTSDVWEANRT